jgi:threonylcarbamoyladenosine tRNA methylthiotransferase CDKAL1
MTLRQPPALTESRPTPRQMTAADSAMIGSQPVSVGTSPVLPGVGGNGKQAYIFSSGCVRRALDMTRIHEYLVRNGWSLTDSVPKANLIMISTCGAVEKTERLSLAAIEEITKKRSPSAQVIITGCLPNIHRERIAALGDFLYVPVRDLESLDEMLQAQVRWESVPDANMLTEQGGIRDFIFAYRLFRSSPLLLRLVGGVSTNRMFLKCSLRLSRTGTTIKSLLRWTPRKKIVPYFNLRIAEGCVSGCTYCAIRFATGKLKSKPEEVILQEFREGLKAGYRIFQLVAEDTGCYGRDIGTNITSLLRKLLAVPGDYRLVVIDFNPQWIVRYYEELLPLLREHRSKIAEWFVPIQSGSNRILKAMRRPYDIEDVTQKLVSLRQEMPEVIWRTTVIIGFPGETQEDHEQTKEVIRRLAFAEVELDKYEDRPGTKSSRMPDKIPPAEIERRYDELRKISR